MPVLRSFVAALRSDATLAMATRATQGAAMGVGALFVIWNTSPSGQGFYFAFISFGILLQLCDFGLSYASLQSASHLVAIGRTAELKALASRALRINGVVTAVATLLVAALGAWMFARVEGDASTDWPVAWFAFVAGVGFNHLTAPFIFLVEGGVSVTRAWRFRLLQEALSGLALLAVLSSGQALWALAAYFWMRCILAAAWMRRTPLGTTNDAAKNDATTDGTLSLRRWRDELWPFQWRVGLSAISGYLVFQAFGPILFALHGPADAGRFAVSLSVMNAIVMVTTAWPVSQAAHFGVLLGRHQGRDLSMRWTRLLLQSTAFAALGVVATIAVFFVLRDHRPDVMDRFADPATTVLLVASAVAHHVVACVSVVLRSERRDPLLVLGIVAGVVTVGGMTIAAAYGALTAIASTYFACTFATVPLAFAIHRRFAVRQRGAAT